MTKRRVLCMVIACALLLGTMPISAGAVQVETVPQNRFNMTTITPYASGSFSMTIPAKSYTVANSSFHLAAWETITISASFSPYSASLNFGFIGPDNVFRYVSATDGSINETIQVNQSGDYTFKIQNNSSVAVEVSGYINY